MTLEGKSFAKFASATKTKLSNLEPLDVDKNMKGTESRKYKRSKSHKCLLPQQKVFGFQRLTLLCYEVLFSK